MSNIIPVFGGITKDPRLGRHFILIFAHFAELRVFCEIHLFLFRYLIFERLAVFTVIPYKSFEIFENLLLVEVRNYNSRYNVSDFIILHYFIGLATFLNPIDIDFEEA
jgi:hypothetical protein